MSPALALIFPSTISEMVFPVGTFFMVESNTDASNLVLIPVCKSEITEELMSNLVSFKFFTLVLKFPISSVVLVNICEVLVNLLCKSLMVVDLSSNLLLTSVLKPVITGESGPNLLLTSFRKLVITDDLESNFWALILLIVEVPCSFPSKSFSFNFAPNFLFISLLVYPSLYLLFINKASKMPPKAIKNNVAYFGLMNFVILLYIRIYIIIIFIYTSSPS